MLNETFSVIFKHRDLKGFEFWSKNGHARFSTSIKDMFNEVLGNKKKCVCRNVQCKLVSHLLSGILRPKFVVLT